RSCQGPAQGHSQLATGPFAFRLRSASRPLSRRPPHMNDEEHTEKLESADQQEDSAPRRFYRSRRNRLIAGVAGGLGRYFRVDPIFFRIGFVALAFFGGVGFILYGALWLLVPVEGEA